jgi:hypothetical protein
MGTPPRWGLGGFATWCSRAIAGGGKWNIDSNPHWLGGHWWVVRSQPRNFIVGSLRWLRVPRKTGIIAEINTGQVDARLAPHGGHIGGLAHRGESGPGKLWDRWARRTPGRQATGTWRRGFPGECLVGMVTRTADAVQPGDRGMLPWKWRDPGNRFCKTLVGTIIASSVATGVYFAIAGAVFLDIYKVPQYKFQDWQLRRGSGWAGSPLRW